MAEEMVRVVIVIPLRLLNALQREATEDDLTLNEEIAVILEDAILTIRRAFDESGD